MYKHTEVRLWRRSYLKAYRYCITYNDVQCAWCRGFCRYPFCFTRLWRFTIGNTNGRVEKNEQFFSFPSGDKIVASRAQGLLSGLLPKREDAPRRRRGQRHAENRLGLPPSPPRALTAFRLPTSFHPPSPRSPNGFFRGVAVSAFAPVFLQ